MKILRRVRQTAGCKFNQTDDEQEAAQHPSRIRGSRTAGEILGAAPFAPRELFLRHDRFLGLEQIVVGEKALHEVALPRD